MGDISVAIQRRSDETVHSHGLFNRWFRLVLDKDMSKTEVWEQLKPRNDKGNGLMTKGAFLNLAKRHKWDQRMADTLAENTTKELQAQSENKINTTRSTQSLLNILDRYVLGIEKTLATADIDDVARRSISKGGAVQGHFLEAKIANLSKAIKTIADIRDGKEDKASTNIENNIVNIFSDPDNPDLVNSIFKTLGAVEGDDVFSTEADTIEAEAREITDGTTEQEAETS